MSEVLGLELHAEFGWFRFFDPVSGEYLPDNQENQLRRVEAERGWASERHARQEAERDLSSERHARQELERLLCEHGIDPPTGLQE